MSATSSREASVAAKWWADQLRGPSKMDAGSQYEDRDSRGNLAFAEVMMTMLSANDAANRDTSDADRFEAALAAYVDRHLAASEYGCTLSTDYAPDYELADVARSCDVRLGMSSLPIKTVMWIKRGSVRLSHGVRRRGRRAADVIVPILIGAGILALLGVGLFVLCLCAVAGQSDRDLEKISARKAQQLRREWER